MHVIDMNLYDTLTFLFRGWREGGDFSFGWEKSLNVKCTMYMLDRILYVHNYISYII